MYVIKYGIYSWSVKVVGNLVLYYFCTRLVGNNSHYISNEKSVATLLGTLAFKIGLRGHKNQTKTIKSPVYTKYSTKHIFVFCFNAKVSHHVAIGHVVYYKFLGLGSLLLLAPYCKPWGPLPGKSLPFKHTTINNLAFCVRQDLKRNFYQVSDQDQISLTGCSGLQPELISFP